MIGAASRHPGELDGEVPGEEVRLEIDGIAVRVWCAVGLDRFVDAERLLRGESGPEPPYWMHLWPGALAVARQVARAPEVGPGTRILELGCGLGLPALVAARRGARVVACDALLAPLRFARRSAAASDTRLDLIQMDWSAPALRTGFDVCVGADVGYDIGSEPALAAAITELLAARGVVWLADSVNTARGSLARRLADTGFTVATHEVRECEDSRPVWVRFIEARRTT
jgi:predicted nicotinamide N-methyase